MLTASFRLIVALVPGSVFVGYWGLASWDGFVVQTLVPMERVEQEQGLELVALVVHSIFVGVMVPRMWAFAPHIFLLAKPSPELAAVAQVVHKRLLLQTETSF